MSVRSVEEIINLSDSQSNPNRIAYKHLIKQIDPQIRERAVRHGSLSFLTPSIIWGKPAFDHGKVENKVIKHYAKLGFACFKNDTGEIVIKWKEDEPDQNGSVKSEDSDSDAFSVSSDESLEAKASYSPMDNNHETDSDSDDGKDTTKQFIIEKPSLSQRVSDMNNP